METNEKQVSLDDFKKEAKRRQVKEKLKQTWHDATDWVINNPELSAILGSTFVGVLTAGTKAAGRHANLKKEQELKDLYCYDRSGGHYWRLKRKLTNSEWLEIESRRKSGERMYTILSDMRVLK